MRYCGTAAKAGGNSEHQLHPAARGVSSLLKIHTRYKARLTDSSQFPLTLPPREVECAVYQKVSRCAALIEYCIVLMTFRDATPTRVIRHHLTGCPMVWLEPK